MTKKLFVVLVVVAAMLVTISLAIAAKQAGEQRALDTFEMQKLVNQQGVTAVPMTIVTEPLAPSAFDQSNQISDRAIGGPYLPGDAGAFCDILWNCDITDTLGYNDNQMLGVETFRDTIYLTGAGGTNTPDPNWVYAYLRTGDACQYLYRVQQPTPSGWGWRDIACDGEYLYASQSSLLECFYVTPGGVVSVPENDVNFPSLSVVRAVAWDEDRQVFWAANFSSLIYGFDKTGALQYGPYANSYPLYGMAYDGTWLWCHSQDACKVYQFNPNTGTYTGVYCSGFGDAGGHPAGGLCILEGDPSAKSVTALGVTQYDPVDMMYAMDIVYGGPVGCCQFPDACDMMTEEDCNNAGGTWYPDLQCIGDECTLPVDTVCHMQWDNGSASWYSSGFEVGDQQGNYFNPEAMCPDCGPDVYPFLVTQVSGLFYDHAGMGSVDVIVHLYAVEPDSCAGPGADIYSFATTITDFYPTEAVVPMPEVVCVNEDFIVAFEYTAGSVGTIPCVLWTSESMADCISWLWYNIYSPPWQDVKYFWAGVGYHIIRADGICNSGACAGGVPCDLVQDQGAAASYFGSFAAGDAIAKYFDPSVYCEEPVYPYKIHDVEFLLYDFAGTGTVDIIIDVHTVCHDSCDGPGTQIYKSDPITVTTFYPDWIHLDLPKQVCVWEPFFLSIEYANGATGSTPSFLFDDDVYPCDTCHAWVWFESQGYSPPWWEWSDFWAPPPPGCPIIRVTGFTEHPDCEELPCHPDSVETLPGGPYAAYYWKNPSVYGHKFVAQRFQMPAAYGGRLDKIEIAFYEAGTTGEPDPDFYVWLSDGVYPVDNNPPYQAIGDFHITYEDIVWYTGLTVVETWERGIEFGAGEQFHLGYGHAFIDGDTLSTLSDGGENNSDRSCQYYVPDQIWETILEGYGLGADMMINAVICQQTPPESTFSIACSPYQAFATPGDPPVDLYVVDVGSILGYSLAVDLSCTPPDPGIHVTFNPDNVPAPYTSDVSISVDAVGVEYGDYTLTFCGLGADGQGPKCCDVILTVQPPFDECEVDFYHGMQRGSNFGAVGNDLKDNFVWYGLSTLFDGTFIVSTAGSDSMALDVYNCEYWGWLPSGHVDEYYDAKYNANVCYSNFFTPESVISCEYDSVYIIGIMEECTDFSIKIKIYYNPTEIPIYGMYMSLFEDWDIGTGSYDAYNNWVEMDPDHNLAWQYFVGEPNFVFGTMKAPFYDDPLYNIVAVRNPQYVWPNEGFCDDIGGFWGLDSLYWLITRPGYFPAEMPDTDFSILQTAGPIDLLPGGKHIEIWIDFGRNTDDGLSWSQWWHRVLRYVGFYRGDVNASDTLELPALDVSDLVYLLQYLFQDGPDPIPYVDQGDVNGDRLVNVADAVYLLNYVFHPDQGPPPVDYVRFIHEYWWRWSLFENTNWD